MRSHIARVLGLLSTRGLILVGAVAVCAAIAAVAVAFAWTDPRAATVAAALAAIASTIGVLAAIYLSYQALARTDAQVKAAQDQLEAAKEATELSRRPLLVPIHQPVTFPSSGGQLASHPPTEDRFALASAPATAYAFVAVTKDRFLIPVENMGEGPALRIRATLWCSDGRRALASGTPVVGAGRVGVLVATLRPSEDSLPAGFQAAQADHAVAGTSYWLHLQFNDIFGHLHQAVALFDPRSTGTWHYVPMETIRAHDDESPSTEAGAGY